MNHSARYGKQLMDGRKDDSRLLSDDTIKTFSGHKGISTTQKCYIHQVKPTTDYADVFKEGFYTS